MGGGIIQALHYFKGYKMSILKQSAILLLAASFAFGASGGKLGSPAEPNNASFYTGTIDNAYATSGANVVISSGDSFTYAYGGSDYGIGDRATTNNTLSINGGEVITHAYGGFANSLERGNAVSTGNKLIIINSPATVLPDDVYGGAAKAVHGDATASGNTVVLLNGYMDDILAGRANSDFGSARANNNTLILAGGDVFGTIRGGRSTRSGLGEDLDAFSGNTVSFMAYQGRSKMSTISHFEFYNFYMPSNLFYASTNYLSLQDGGKRAMISNVDIQSGGPRLNIGDKITLLYADSIYGEIRNKGAVIKGSQGLLWSYDFLLGQDANTLNATVINSRQSDEAEFLAQSSAASLQALNVGADLAMDALKDIKSASIDANNTIDLIPFFASSAGSVKSVLRVKEASFIAGLGVKKEHGFGTVIIAPFVESGFGDYSSDLVSGSGDISYIGGGIGARFLKDNAYVEGMFRLGKIKNKFKESERGSPMEFEQNKNYWGFGAGLGYMFEFGAHKIDANAKYLYTHVKNGEIYLFGDSAEFRKVNSKRIKIGVRYSYNALSTDSGFDVEPFAGVYYEHEFSGNPKVFVNRIYEVKSNEAKKNSGVFELGVSMTNSNGLGLQAGVSAYAGGKKGVNGNVRLSYEF